MEGRSVRVFAGRRGVSDPPLRYERAWNRRRFVRFSDERRFHTHRATIWLPRLCRRPWL